MITGILSGKGGTGKTTLTVNLGLALHKLGENIVLVDGDLKNPNMGIHLGMLEHYLTIHDVLEDKLPLLEALHIHETGLRFIPAHISLNYLNTDPGKMKDLFSYFDSNVLLDAPSGLGKDVISLLEVCDEALIVTTPYLPDITDCLKTIEVARNMDVVIKGIVLNNSRKKGYEINEKEIEAISNTDIIQQIPWDENVLKSLYSKIPVVEKNPLSPASISFFELASKVSEKEFKTPNLLALRRLFSGFYF
jgi:septum site-determining protein MinD